MTHSASATSPQIPEDQHSGQEFINGSGIDAAVCRPSLLPAGLSRRDQPVGKRHAPRPRPVRRFAVVAVTGDQAADAPYNVAYGHRRAGHIQHGPPAYAVAARQQHQSRDAGNEASEPGEAAAQPSNDLAAQEEIKRWSIAGSIDDVPQLGAQNAGDGHIRYNAVGIEVQLAPLDLRCQREVSGNKGQAHQQAEGWNFERLPDVNIT